MSNIEFLPYICEVACPVCRGSIEKTSISCQCGATYHEDCATYLGTCAIYGCDLWEKEPIERTESISERYPPVCGSCGEDAVDARRCKHCGIVHVTDCVDAGGACEQFGCSRSRQSSEAWREKRRKLESPISASIESSRPAPSFASVATLATVVMMFIPLVMLGFTEEIVGLYGIALMASIYCDPQ